MGGGAKIVFVAEFQAGRQNRIQARLHTLRWDGRAKKILPHGVHHAGIQFVADAVNGEGAQMSATFQPDIPEELIHVRQGGRGRDFEVEPVFRESCPFRHQPERFLLLSPRFQDNLFCAAGFDVTCDDGLAERLAAKITNPFRY